MAKRSVAPIHSERLRLRLLEDRDLPTTLAWRNQDHVRRWFFDDRAIGADDHRRWFLDYQLRDDDFVFIAEDATESSRPIGQVSVYRVDGARGIAEVGRLLFADDSRSRGFATEATAAVLRWAFATWRLERIVAEVYSDNAPSLRLFSRCGFRVVGSVDGISHLEVTPETLVDPSDRLRSPAPDAP